MVHEHRGSIIPLFCFNPVQVDKRENRYYNPFAIQFMCEALDDLDAQLKGHLNRMQGDEVDCIAKIRKQHNVSVIYQNNDITPFAQKRCEKLAAYCDQHDMELVNLDGDYTLFNLDNIQTHVKLFAKFKEIALRSLVQKPLAVECPTSRLVKLAKNKQYKHKYQAMPAALVHGGRGHALEILMQIKQFKRYDTSRDQIWNDKGTTHLSPFLKFGCLSVRELHWAVVDAFGKGHGLINELIWRSYFDYLVINFPSMLRGQLERAPNMSLSSTFHNHVWSDDESAMERWKSGKTGIPIIDAAMNELHTTGYMHNRCRMVVAMYAVRDLNLNWNECERHFAQHLLDYAPAQNVGNWSWILSYRFKFNPYLQQRKFDKDCVYTRKWLPLLAHLSNKQIHDPKYNYL